MPKKISTRIPDLKSLDLSMTLSQKDYLEIIKQRIIDRCIDELMATPCCECERTNTGGNVQRFWIISYSPPKVICNECQDKKEKALEEKA